MSFIKLLQIMITVFLIKFIHFGSYIVNTSKLVNTRKWNLIQSWAFQILVACAFFNLTQLYTQSQHAKKILFNSLGLVEFILHLLGGWSNMCGIFNWQVEKWERPLGKHMKIHFLCTQDIHFKGVKDWNKFLSSQNMYKFVS